LYLGIDQIREQIAASGPSFKLLVGILKDSYFSTVYANLRKKLRQTLLQTFESIRYNFHTIMKNTFQKLFLGTFMGLLAAGCSFFGKGSEEQPSYQIVAKQGNKEIRKYDSYVIAKTTVSGSFKDAQSEGFNILAGYIFGKNKSQQKIAMTAPVVQKAESEKISMTAPVVISSNKNKTWTMTFSMPSKFTLETLPVPTDERVKIEKVEEKFVAALTFSGFWNESKNAEKGKELKEWMRGYKEYQLTSQPMFAGYNPPWTLPFLRRNEMLIELTRRPDSP
jgi:hypothetical protein